MRWYFKSAGFKVLSTVPGGTRLYSFAQEHITRSTIPSRERVSQKIEVGLLYWNWLKAHGYAETLRRGTLLDFGAGWHPTIPFLFYSLGVERQYLLDLSPLMRAEQCAATLKFFRALVAEPVWPARGELVRLPEPPGANGAPLEEWLRSLGMNYRAPYTPESGELREGVDVAICTQVLLHIGREGLRHCLALLRDCLKPGGVFLGTIHLMDLHSLADRRIGPYNHLKYSPWFWERVVNSPLMPFNRFKARDYRAAFETAGFRILDFEVNQPTDEDFAQLKRVRVHSAFRDYTPAELAAKHLFFAVQRA